MDGLQILIGREHVDPRLLMGADPSLARVMGQLNHCTCFAGMLDDKNVVASLLDEHSDGICDVVNFAVDESLKESDIDKEVLLYMMDYARTKGFRFMEIGAGNAQLQSHRMLQKMGFRVTGVVPDYYQADGKSLAVENGIVNRDMVRYRADFQDGWVTWTEEVKYK